jgi:hypothetical protein
MAFSILFLLWAAVLVAAWVVPRAAVAAAFVVMLGLSLALFIRHVTDPLTLSF